MRTHTPSILLPDTDTTPQHRLSVEYAQLDAADPKVTISRINSLLLFGLSIPKDNKDPRCKALAKLKVVAAQHGIHHITPREYMLALSVHTAFVNRRPTTKRPRPLPLPNRPIRADHLQLFHHMLRHAESIYGLPLNVASAPRVSLTKVTDRGIICRRTGVAPSDLLVAEFTTSTFLPAHYVAIDRSINAIVVCIRGTANIVDSFTDIAATHDPLSIQATGPEGLDTVDGFAHTGMLRSARNLFAKIRAPILAAVKEHDGFELLVTGHSMGGAITALLALIMNDDPDFPRATAICIAPPPCMTHELAEATESNTITLVNGPDIVPRISVGRMLPFFATARYIAGLPRSQKALLACGLVRKVINWQELEAHNNRVITEMKRLHEGLRLYLPGKLFQMVRKDQMNSSEPMKSRLFKHHDVEIIPLRRSELLSFKGPERGMFVAHAPFSYRASLMAALKSMGSSPLKKMQSCSVLGNLFSLPANRTPAHSADSLDRQESVIALIDELAADIESSLDHLPSNTSISSASD